MSRRLILPGPQKPSGSLTVFVPRGYEDDDPRSTGHCNLCGVQFFPGDDTTAHFKRCARENADTIREAREEKKKRLAVFQDDAWDTELQAHLKKVGNRMLREGRLTMKKNERSYE